MSTKEERIATLFAFYGPLLTKKQQEMVYDHIYEDISLGEIASNYQISRAAVYDTIKRCTKIMEDYEQKLHLISKYTQRMAIYSKIQAYNNKDINALVKALLENEE